MASSKQQVYLSMRKAILAGEYAPGAHLTAEGIAQRLDVSRTPARESLLLLEADGLVRIFPHQGAFVATWSYAELVEIYSQRAVLEPLAAEAAASRIGEGPLEELRTLIQRMESAVAGGESALDLSTLSQANDRFHRVIAECSESNRLKTTIYSLLALPMGMTVFRISPFSSILRILAHYREILAAFEAHDPHWAQAAMRCHVLSARAVYVRLANEESAAQIS
jgi:DNA-binding GntR family transcriptional regulator